MFLEKKAILVIVDGLGDRVAREGKTPLQLTKKPNLDELAREGSVGLMNALGPGVIPGSDTSHLAILGYEPSIYYKGRGPLEALGVGINLKEGDVAFRCNFATVDEELKIIDRRAGRLKDEGKELAKSLQGLKIEGIEVIFASSTEHRGVLVLRGDGLSSDISDTDPHTSENVFVLESKPLNPGKETKKTAKIVNEVVKKSKDILSSHPINKQREKEGKLPANIILTRGAGAYQKVESLKDRYGFNSCCIAGAALYKGVAIYVGMEVLEVPGATGRIDTDIEAKAFAAKEALKKFDFVFIHIKGTDSASHDGNLKDKILMIEKVDKLVNLLKKEDAYLIVTADHSTPVSIKRHSSDSVPLLIYGGNIRKDKVKFFDEISASSGCLGHLTGIQLNKVIIDLMGCGHIVGS
ncbi:2,3-bisphosphoglycerate-independent phosphoglycerate mutase [Candidatus Aerophobetes bacterium]|nr:2,3-bisphosphoglycerate-independent phosphoglycerate mutase [Candidatus Aerophobetes bacterium]